MEKLTRNDSDGSFKTLSDDDIRYPKIGSMAKLLSIMEEERPDLKRKYDFKKEEAIEYVDWVRDIKQLSFNDNKFHNYNNKQNINDWLNKKYGTRKPKPPSKKRINNNTQNTRARKFKVPSRRGRGINKRRKTKARRKSNY